MLIELSVTNFKSIRDTQTLSMVPVKAMKEHSDSHLIETNDTAVPNLLKSAVIYGANAAGKSNFLEALDVLEAFVLSSSSMQLGDKIPVSPYKFTTEEKVPTTIEVSFISEGTRYQYGFSANREKVFEEWLFSFPKKRLFERWCNEEGKAEFYVNPTHLASKKQANAWMSSTRANALFLSTAIQLNSEVLVPVYNWFRKRLRTRISSTRYTSSQSHKNEEFKSKVLSFIKHADLGITSFEIEAEELELSSYLEKIAVDFDMPDWMRVSYAEELKNNPDVPKKNTMYRELFKHGKGLPNNTLHLEDQSEGTKELYALAGPLLNILQEGKVAVADEFNLSLHPHLFKAIINMFNDKEINKNQAQLIFSTHDCMPLDQSVMRRDQVWFMEKTEQLTSELYSLAEFKPRKNESLGKGYLAGRYGAVPFLDTFDL